MTKHLVRKLETAALTVLFLNLAKALCWGPPGPPTPNVPVGTPATLAVTAALIAGYALWKHRR